MAAKSLDPGIDDDYLNEVAENLVPDSSAIVATVEFTNVEAAMDTLDRFKGGTILHTTLQPKIAAQLSDAVED